MEIRCILSTDLRLSLLFIVDVEPAPGSLHHVNVDSGIIISEVYKYVASMFLFTLTPRMEAAHTSEMPATLAIST
jgi:hypothetical protein